MISFDAISFIENYPTLQNQIIHRKYVILFLDFIFSAITFYARIERESTTSLCQIIFNYPEAKFFKHFSSLTIDHWSNANEWISRPTSDYRHSHRSWLVHTHKHKHTHRLALYVVGWWQLNKNVEDRTAKSVTLHALNWLFFTMSAMKENDV